MVINELYSFYKNIQGWKTGRKIIVFESDDWGSIRMPSKETYNQLLSQGIRVDKCPYNRYDSLATREDLAALFTVLIKFKDKNNNHPVITANTVVANPDFEKIRNSGFREYHYEPFTETLNRFESHKEVFSLWKEGIDKKIFYPQFHGREHLNVNRWMSGLRAGLPETLLAFDQGVFGISLDITSEKRKSYLAALELDDLSELDGKKQILKEGLAMFEAIFGYRSQSFIAPNYHWHSDLEQTLGVEGVKYLQGQRAQIQSDGNNAKIIRHIPGSRNALGQVYLYRNCFFEPSLNPAHDWVNSCLREIKWAFMLKKPAIITTHRVNFIGSIIPSNRNRNLVLFEKLLLKITKRWPDVEFLTSRQLGNIITNTIKIND